MGQFIMVVLLGCFVLVMGYLIIAKNALSLIIGYTNLSGFRNERSYAISMGVLAFITGIVIIVFSFGKYFYGNIANEILTPIGVVLLALFFLTDNIWRLKFIKKIKK